MQEIEVDRRYDASPQAVWDVYTDHTGWSDWAGFGRVSLEVPGNPHRNGVGAVRLFARGGLREQVLDFDPPKRMTYRIVGGGGPMLDHLGEVTFEPDAGGTRVEWRCRFNSRIPGLGAPMRWFITRMFRNALESLARCHFPDSARPRE